jgi:hypothetical protein
MLGWHRHGFDKKSVGTHYAELVFLHPVGSASHVVHSSVSEARNSDTLFFMLRWDMYGVNKKHTGTHYADLVFLHPMGFAGHVVHSSASGERNGDALFSWSSGVRYGFDDEKCRDTSR